MSTLPLTFLYPPAEEDIGSISDAAQLAKISRHSPCSICTECEGLHPPEGWDAIADDSEDAAAVLGRVEDESEWLTEEGYLRMCACGHEFVDHGCPPNLERGEFIRRAKYAARIDQILEEEGHLLDFSYVNDDIAALRRRMELQSEAHESDEPSQEFSPQPSSPASTTSALSDVPYPSNKRRRITSESLSEDEDDDEDKPLATLLPAQETNGRTHRRNQGSGKKSSLGHSSVSKKVPRETHPDMRAEVIPSKVRTEEVKVDAGQLARLVTGVTVDAGLARSEPTVRREKPAVIEEQKGIIRFVVVKNDGSTINNILLTGLKTLFQRQLPMMPREYVTRLVFDKNSEALAVVQRGWKVVGGITYRPFPHRTFAEIVFFAITGVYQVNGYGGHLMNNFKMHIRKSMPSIMHFLTYADNSAIGYFKKQGFTKEITLDRSLWVGYIKDYDGGTIMQCSMLPKVDYLHVQDILSQQKEVILDKIRSLSRSHTIVHPGLQQFKNASEGFKVDPGEVPGLKETGWNPEMDEIFKRPFRGPHYNLMQRLLTDLQQHHHSWAFLNPVNKDEAPDYYDVIKDPMDLSTMEQKLEKGVYTSLEEFVEDAMLIFSNCRTYNAESSTYYKHAVIMEKYVKSWLAERRRR